MELGGEELQGATAACGAQAEGGERAAECCSDASWQWQARAQRESFVALRAGHVRRLAVIEVSFCSSLSGQILLFGIFEVMCLLSAILQCAS